MCIFSQSMCPLFYQPIIYLLIVSMFYSRPFYLFKCSFVFFCVSCCFPYTYSSVSAIFNLRLLSTSQYTAIISSWSWFYYLTLVLPPSKLLFWLIGSLILTIWLVFQTFSCVVSQNRKMFGKPTIWSK